MPYRSPNVPNMGYGNRLPQENVAVVSSSETIYMTLPGISDEEVPIAMITSLHYDTSRELKEQREGNYKRAGRVIELTPGVESIKLRAEGVCTYGATLGGRIAGNEKGEGAPLTLSSLHRQGTYFNIVQEFVHPYTGEIFKRTWYNCLISGLSSDWNITTPDVGETADMTACGMNEEHSDSGGNTDIPEFQA